MPQTKSVDNKFADVPMRVKTWVYIILAFAIGISHPILMKIFVSYLCFQSFYEFLRMFKIKTNTVLIAAGLGLSQLLLLYFFDFNTYFIYSTIISTVVLLSFRFAGIKLKQLFPIAFALLVCLFSLAFLSFIRDVNLGLLSIIFLVVTTELNDVFQYLMGKFFGKHKIVPKISPNKTVEGFLGGLMLTIILSNILGYFLLETSVLINTILGLMLGAFGFLGDITMSYIKRKANVKDTGNLLPGHGGLLDRIDSLIYNAPVFFLFVYLINN